MKKIVSILTAFVLIMSFSVTAFAAPKTMKDGQVFDASYYAANNPDVVSVYGTSEKALYKHYTNHGKKEGRLPYAPVATATQTTAASSSVTVTAPTTTVTTEQQTAINNTLVTLKSLNTKQNVMSVPVSFSPVSADFENALVASLKQAGYTVTPQTTVVNQYSYWTGLIYSYTAWDITGNGIIKGFVGVHDDPVTKEISCYSQY